MPEKLKCGAYVEYLEKEMTIMGVLSAFCVFVAALSLDRTMGAATDSALAQTWKQSSALIAAASAAALWACFKFYLQRSSLAWYYGQLVLYETRKDMDTTESLLTDADAWDSWLQYRLGFLWLFVSFTFIACAVARYVEPASRSVRQRHLLAAVVILAMIYSFMTRHLLKKYRLRDDSPWLVWWRSLWNRPVRS